MKTITDKKEALEAVEQDGENLMLYRESCKGLEGKAEVFTSGANEILKLASKRLQKDPELQNLCIIDA